ncbi:Qat anti-phage system TatD family nuclease QatD [Hydrogenophaga sp.]|uniref:Qat anti-phage system TatD family nuclease QatD n=1 Tax=Hydrogenophaga sp. TaxID=1904254 RepID=UPI00271E1121|nr:Qat anti-phage system TatD family nuclease QatD [Hydrogenophaga sp.]MDO9437714.1 Qat anti-phage system TatD family nuclease QatD [Hydrogenophaga sp.]
MIDFHCHLDLYPDALALLPQVSARNLFTLVVTTSPRAFLATSRVFAGHSRIHVGLGLHPEVAAAKVGEVDQLVALVKGAPIVGEIGLDGSPRFRATLPTQRRIFSAVIAECEAQGGRVMSIHSRGAESEVLDVLEKHPRAGVAVLHWFSGTKKELQRAIELGAWFSVGPAMLRGLKGRQLAARMPSSRVLPETDGPFAQDSGRPLMPWQAWSVCPTLAAAWGLTADAVQEEMLVNLRRLLPTVPTA